MFGVFLALILNIQNWHEGATLSLPTSASMVGLGILIGDWNLYPLTREVTDVAVHNCYSAYLVKFFRHFLASYYLLGCRKATHLAE